MDLKQPTDESKAYHLWQLLLTAIVYAENDLINNPETEPVFREDDGDDEASLMNNAVAQLKQRVSREASCAIKFFDSEWFTAKPSVRKIVSDQIIKDDERSPVIDAWLAARKKDKTTKIVGLVRGKRVEFNAVVHENEDRPPIDSDDK